jgi:hypothetical protein
MRVRTKAALRAIAVLALVLGGSLFAATSSASAVRFPPFFPCALGFSTKTPCIEGSGRQLQFGTDPPSYQFAIEAVGGGTAVHGWLVFSPPGLAPGPDHVIRVDCLKVTGDHAIATGRIILPHRERGHRVVMEATDLGVGFARDLLRFSFKPFITHDPSDLTGTCWLPVLPPVPIFGGDILVGYVQ